VPSTANIAPARIAAIARVNFRTMIRTGNR
jgi:hypothetical protein